MDLILAGTQEDGELLINMIEGNFEEIEESLITEALKFAEPYLKELFDFQKEVAAKIGKEKAVLPGPENDPGLEKEMKEFLAGKLEAALYQKDSLGQMKKVDDIKEELLYFIENKYPGPPAGGGKIQYAQSFFDNEIDNLIHQKIIREGKRPDGRKLDELRQIQCQAGLLPRTHGSGLFCRGQTKALSILTLGAPGDHQLLEGMEIVGKKRFMHHYNFPPYSVGEVKPMRGPGRRDIGHGMLAEKTLLPLIPSIEDFPYTIRVVSEILSWTPGV